MSFNNLLGKKYFAYKAGRVQVVKAYAVKKQKKEDNHSLVHTMGYKAGPWAENQCLFSNTQCINTSIIHCCP